MAYAKIRPRRGTLYEWTSINPIIAEGEFVIEVPETGVGTGLCRFKLGDGITPYDELPYSFDAAEANSVYGGTASDSHNIYQRSDTLEEWEAIDPVLGLGEIVVVYDEDGNIIGIKIGDGVHSFSELPYFGQDLDFGFEEEYQ